MPITKEVVLQFREAFLDALGLDPGTQDVTKLSDARKKFVWLNPLLGRMHWYTVNPSRESLKDLKKEAKQIPHSEELEEVVGMLGFLLREEEQQYKKKEAMQARMENNTFRVGASLSMYRESFGGVDGPFWQALWKFDDTSRWLDGGAGEAKAMIQHLDTGGKGICVATAYELPRGAEETVNEAKRKYEHRFFYISGKYLRGFTALDLHAGADGFDLITDHNGVLYYTETLQEDLAYYLNLLKVGGLLVSTTFHAEIEMPNAAPVHSNGNTNFGRWASNIAGATVNYHKQGFYEIRRTARKIKVPTLQKVQYESQVNQNNPIRKYACNHTLPLAGQVTGTKKQV